MRRVLRVLGATLILGSLVYLFGGKPSLPPKPAPWAGPVANFSQLRQGDVVEMDYSSVGCFGSAFYRFRLETNQLAVTQLNRTWTPEETRARVTNGVFLGNLSLTAAELEGLDNWLFYFRSPNGAGCTTVIEMHLRQFRNNQIVAEEHLIDASCSTDRVSGVLTVFELFEKLTPGTSTRAL